MEEITHESMEPAPLRSEVEWALNRLRNGKSPGTDNIPIEMWKASGLLWKICKMVWEMKEWPRDWCRPIFVPLPKNGDKKECSNNRTISLIVHASKIILKIIINRIIKKQAGFVEDKGTRDQIVNIRNIMEKWKNHDIPINLCFIDYAKAFDCVSHAQLRNIITKMAFPRHIIDLIKKLYENQETTGRTACGNTECFKIRRGGLDKAVLCHQPCTIFMPRTL